MVVYVVSSATIGFGVEPDAAPAVDPGGVLYCGLAAVPLAIDVVRRAAGHHRRRPADAVGAPA